MKPWNAGRLAALLLAGMACGAVDTGLPNWNEGGRTNQAPTGSPLTEQDPRTTVEPLDIAPPSAEDLAVTAMPTEELPEKHWAAYFGERPLTFLVDPQGLLNAADSRDRLAFLKDHAADSRIDLFVYVFKGNQELPGQVRAEELIERFFASGRPAALVYYYLGAPRRSMLYLSPSLTDVVSAPEQRRALESSVMQASATTDPSTQFETFLVQMSRSIYWMERMVGGAATAREGTPEFGKKVKAAEKKSAFLEKLRPLLEKAARFRIPAAVAAGLLIAGWLAGACLRRRVRYRFPVVAVEPRLGGDHGAGVGAVISFFSATVSPASQRNQL